MAVEFDLNFYPLCRIKGQDLPQLPGLLVCTPPKHAARGRQDDRLVIYLSLSGNTPLSSAEYSQITAQMAQRYYQNSGSLTSAIRTTAETLNKVLVERNLRTTGKGQYILGRLVLGVLRGAQFVIAQCGPTHVFHLTGGEARLIHDAQISGRGLGFTQTTPLYFAQADLRAGDLLILCAQLPPVWENNLLAERSPSADALRRKLPALTSDDMNAVLIQVLAGKGNLNVFKGTRPAEAPAAAKAQAPADLSPAPPSEKLRSASRGAIAGPVPPAPAGNPPPPPPAAPRLKTSQVESSQPASRFTRILSGEQEEASTGPAKAESAVGAGAAPAPAGQPTRQVRRVATKPGVAPRPEQPASAASVAVARRPSRFIASRTRAELPVISRSDSSSRRKVFLRLANGLQGMRRFIQRITQGVKTFLPHLLPNLKEEATSGSGSSMAFIAIAIPLLVVTVASMVYLRFGRITQFRENYDQAVAAAVKAISQSDPLEVRHGWESALYFLDKAESYQVTQESQELRREAQTALDNLDGIVRLDFRPAIINGLSRAVQVSRMAASDTDLFLLNAARGNVLRAFMTNQGYEVDPSFKCEAGQYGATSVGTLIDIEALPKVNRRNASLLAMDANGTLLYCAAGSDPVPVPLAAPELGFRGISGFALDADGRNLYLLDPAANAVWVYAGDQGDFSNLPIMFFGEQVPQNMNTAIDLAANGSDLYLLFQDGHITACTLGRLDVVPTRCTDPTTFVDNRPGQKGGSRISDAIFTQINFAAPPDPSLYLFEPLTQAVYRFSPRPDLLTLQGQFRAAEDERKSMLAEQATAMAISPDRYLFLSVGNQVYFASDVP